MEEEHETSSLWARRKKSSVSLTCCFSGHGSADSFDVMSSSSSSICPSPRISPSAWIRSKTNELHDINIKARCKTLMSRVGRHRRHSLAEFSYDPVSYSLNFEDTDHHHHHPSEVEEFPMNFAARLPLSPPPSAAGRIMLDMQPQMRTLTDLHEHPTRPPSCQKLLQSLLRCERTCSPWWFMGQQLLLVMFMRGKRSIKLKK